jgi:polyisoprenoid-binding protein YceI
MKRALRILVMGAWVSSAASAFAQKYMLESSTISFFSDAAIEDITASNTKTSGLIDVSTLSIAFSVPISEFQFEKSLMKEHFNEKYMESDKYPKATFQGKLTSFNLEPGIQNSTATGKLVIHGISRDVSIPGTIEYTEGKLILNTRFMVKLEDHKIKIPQLLWQNIAEQVEVTANLTYKPQ